MSLSFWNLSRLKIDKKKSYKYIFHISTLPSLWSPSSSGDHIAGKLPDDIPLFWSPDLHIWTKVGTAASNAWWRDALGLYSFFAANEQRMLFSDLHKRCLTCSFLGWHSVWLHVNSFKAKPNDANPSEILYVASMECYMMSNDVAWLWMETSSIFLASISFEVGNSSVKRCKNFCKNSKLLSLHTWPKNLIYISFRVDGAVMTVPGTDPYLSSLLLPHRGKKSCRAPCRIIFHHAWIWNDLNRSIKTINQLDTQPFSATFFFWFPRLTSLSDGQLLGTWGCHIQTWTLLICKSPVPSDPVVVIPVQDAVKKGLPNNSK